MAAKHENPYAELERVFHEPNRLAIMTTLCGAPDGMSFTAIKEACDLTDGNLSRHLKVLCEARAVRIKKAFVGSKPQTTVYVTEAGRISFVQYLEALETVLKDAAKKAKPPAPRRARVGKRLQRRLADA